MVNQQQWHWLTYNGIVASNNLSDVEEYIESLDIELITSSMILSKAVEKDIVSENTANGLWKGMIKEGIDLPKNSFTEYHDELYESDCERFLKSERLRNVVNIIRL